MKQTKILMGMPVTIEIADDAANSAIFEKIFSYFQYVDNKFSTYKKESEISLFNKGRIKKGELSEDIKVIFSLSEETKKQTNGYFDILNGERYDPSGLVKGWAIYNGAKLLRKSGFGNFYIDAGGDIQTSGKNTRGKHWRIGIKNPFKDDEIVKVLYAQDEGIATSGTYIRGQHIYNPKNRKQKITDIVSLTVIGPNIYEADRFATAAFAMGKNAINFIEKTKGLEGYMIDKDRLATFTSGFERYTKKR